MDWQAVTAQHLAGQDQMFGFLSHALDAARPRLAPHRDKSEGLLADAQVLLVHLPSRGGAHVPHLFQVFWFEEGLCGSATACLILYEGLPFVLVERSWCARENVALEESVVAIVPSGALAGSFVSGRRLMAQQQTDGKNEKTPEGSHYPQVLQ